MSDADEAMPVEDAGGTDAQASSARIPPYIPFKTFLTFLNELKTNGLPPQIDGSVLRRFSGGTQSQLKMAVKSLGLLDNAKPTAGLAALVDAYETPQFEPMLLALLKSNYPYVFALDLMSATPTMFADAFKVTGAKEDVSRKCRTFFLHAAKRAGVPLGQRILTGSVPRTQSNGAPKRRAKKEKDAADTVATGDSGHSTHRKPAHGGDVLDKLLAKFPEFDPAWPAELKEKWFENFGQFMKAAKVK
jgi:hypothetical protein